MREIEQFVHWLNTPWVIGGVAIVVFLAMIVGMMEEGFSFAQAMTLMVFCIVLVVVGAEILFITSGDGSWLWQLWQSSRSS